MRMPKPANGSMALAPYAGERYTSSTQAIVAAMGDLFDRITDPRLMVRRITVVATQLNAYAPDGGRSDDATVVLTPPSSPCYEQPDLFTDLAGPSAKPPATSPGAPAVSGASGTGNAATRHREHDMQETLLAVKRRFGRNAVIKGMNLEPDATGRDRNNQIGGHAA